MMVLIALVGCSSEAPEFDPPHVVVLVMDGVRAEDSFGDGVSSATGEAPSEDLMVGSWGVLVPQAARAVEAWNVAATITAPAHATMSSGRRQPLANYAPEGGPGVYVPELPGLGHALLEAGADPEQVLFVGNTEHLAPLVETLWPADRNLDATYAYVGGYESGILAPADDDAQVLAAVMEHMEAHDTRFIMANLHQVDREGHWGNESAYPSAVKAIDQELPAFWKFVQSKAPYKNNTWVVVVSDHGRHQDIDDGDPPPWRHHGDSCLGCRHVPLLVLGPGVADGATVDAPVLHEDLAPTLAALLGVPLPWAEGRVAQELFDRPLPVLSRSGVADLRVAGGVRAELVYLDGAERRTELTLNGEVVSDPDATVVAAPALAASGALAWSCWREITVTREASTVPWVGRCLGSSDGGASWADLGFPEDIAGPYMTMALAALPDALVMAWPDNPNAITTPGLEGDEVGVKVAVNDGGAWSVAESVDEVSFPTDPSLVTVDDARLALALAGGLPGDDSRHTRRLWVWPVLRDGATISLGPAVDVTFGTLDPGDGWRLEHPALRWDAAGGRYELAAIASGADDVWVVRATSVDLVTWTDERRVEAPIPPAPHLAPVWVGDELVFAAVARDGSMVSLCRDTDGAVACEDTGSPRISALSADGDDVHAVIDAGVGAWSAL